MSLLISGTAEEEEAESQIFQGGEGMEGNRVVGRRASIEMRLKTVSSP